MVLNQHKRVIGVFSSYKAAILALDHLILSGFPPAKVFLVGKDLVGKKPQDDPAFLRELENQALAGAIARTTTWLRKGLVVGNVVGGVTGLLLGLGILALPGVTQVMVASAIAVTLTSSGICTIAGGLIGTLIGLRMTKRQMREYGALVSNGNYLIIVDGTEDEIYRAARILNSQGIRKILKFLEDA